MKFHSYPFITFTALNIYWKTQVQEQTQTVGTTIEKEFLAENTQLTTNMISRKLDELEKIVKEGPASWYDKLERQSTYHELDTLIRQRSFKREQKKTAKSRLYDITYIPFKIPFGINRFNYFITFYDLNRLLCIRM